MESANGAAGAVGFVAVAGQDDGGTTIFFDDTGCGNADHATMPTFAIHDDAVGVTKFGTRLQRRIDLFEDARFFTLAIAVQLVQLLREIARFGGIAGAEEVDDVAGDVHASGGVETGRDAEGDVAGADGL